MKALVLALAIGLAGCATLFAGGPDEIPINTNPPGAYVYVNGQVVGQTPMIVQMSRGQAGQIQIYLPGFQPVMLWREKSVNGWFWANILWLPTFLWVIDLIDGDWQQYDATPIAIGLTPAVGGAQPMQPAPMQPPIQPPMQPPQ